MFQSILFREKSKLFFFSKNPTIFGPLCPFLGKKECSSKFCSYQYLLKKFQPSIIMSKFEGKVMSGFQVTLISQESMYTHMEQTYHETLTLK